MCPAFISNCIVIMQMHFTLSPFSLPLILSHPTCRHDVSAVIAIFPFTWSICLYKRVIYT